MSTLDLGGGLLDAATADVGRARERRRRHRLRVLAAVAALPAAFLWYRLAVGRPFDVFRLPSLNIDWTIVAPFAYVVILAVGIGLYVWASGRSPHVLYRPEQLGVRLADVVGIEEVKEEVVRSLNLFLGHATFAQEMGGTPRRGLLFEGAPGTGKTFTAKAMAAEAGVPFLFVSATAFQSMFYGATARKIRAYFRALRRMARRNGGAIGFIEEIDAIATSRRGLAFSAAAARDAVEPGGDGPGRLLRSPVVSEGVGGVVNELLVQLQSFDTPSPAQRVLGGIIEVVNGWLPARRAIPKPSPAPANVLVIAATNRADGLDPALLRPGRFDRRLTFELPGKAGRRLLVDHFLTSKAHARELDDDARRDALAALTQGYTPVAIEHLFDEALVSALRRGDRAMSWADVEHARLTEEVGMGQPVAYTEHERRLIATHEAGHATMAWLVAPQRRLEVLTIVKRRGALGMLAHGDREDVFTRSRAEMRALIEIAMGGQVAEQLYFGDVSTGPAGDLLYATNLAAEMVGSAGMADSLISLRAVQGNALSETNIAGRVLADPAARAAVDELLHAAHRRAEELLAANRHLLDALRDALLERAELIGEEITDVLRAAQAAPAVPAVPAAPVVPAVPAAPAAPVVPAVPAAPAAPAPGAEGGPVVIDLREPAADWSS